MNESESDFVCSSGRHLNISAFREFTEIPTEHSVAKRARGMFPGNPFIRASLLIPHFAPHSTQKVILNL